MTRLFVLFPLVAVALALWTAGPVRAEADPAAAVKTAEDLVNGAYAVMADSSLPQADRNAALKETIDKAFAFEIWERFILGDLADGMTAGQIAEFRGLLPGFMADLYRTQFGKGLQAKPQIKDVRKARRDLLVRAAIPRANGENLPVDWRVRDFGERGHLVIDIMVGGTSFLILKRDEFRAIVERQGAEALIAFLRDNSLG